MTNGFGCRFGFLLLLTWASASPGLVQIHKSPGRIDYRIEVDRVTLDPAQTFEGEPFIKVRLDGVSGFEGLVAEAGKPEVPAIHFYVDGEGDISVHPGEADSPWSRENVARVVPFQPSPAKTRHAPQVFYFDKAAYQSRELYPLDAYAVENVGFHKGRLRRLVRLFPVRYEAATSRFEIVRKFEVTVLPKPESRPAPGRKTLALVTGAAFENSAAVETLTDFKKAQGYDVVRVHFGRDAKNPAELRAVLGVFYQDAKRDLQEILLIGDNGDVPGYATPLLEGVTDHYYRCLDGVNYEADIGAPDVSLGRLAVQTEAELEIVVKKQLRYERNGFLDKSWQKRFSFIATDDSSHYPSVEGSFDYLTGKYTGPQGFLGNFPKLNQVGGDLLYAIRHNATAEQVVARLEEGRGFVNYSGHGSEDSWEGPEVTAEDVKSIQTEATPFVMANACTTGKFTVDSFAETWLRHEFGAVAYWGSMDSTYWDEDDILQRRVYDMLFQEGNRHVGAFADAGLSEVWRYYGGKNRSKYYWETYEIFGDPDLDVRL